MNNVNGGHVQADYIYTPLQPAYDVHNCRLQGTSLKPAYIVHILIKVITIIIF